MIDINSRQRVITRDPSIVERKIVGEVVLVPIRQNVGDLEYIFTLNEMAGRIWELIDGNRCLGDILDAIVEEFDVGPATAEADLLEFIEQLKVEGLVRDG